MSNQHPLNITHVNAFSDNYIWMLQRPQNDTSGNKQLVIVDPGQSEPALSYIEQHQLEPVAILITHQHYDHTGGVAKIVEQYPNIEVIGPGRSCSEKRLSIDLLIPDLFTRTVSEGDVVTIDALDISFEVIEIPGHTLDHLAYIGEGLVFCGDTLFAAGCGRLFSGTAEMMSKSLGRLGQLPAKTLMYCTHEYTVDNLGFAKWVEPENSDILQRDSREMERQEKGQPTVPTSVELELKTNPFMRLNDPQVRQAAENYAGKALTQDWQVFAALREWKDTKYD